jgi:hypothetical protein
VTRSNTSTTGSNRSTTAKIDASAPTDQFSPLVSRFYGCYNTDVLAIAVAAAAFALPGPPSPPVRHVAIPSSGIRGLVFIGPVCPVERIPPDPDCAPRPYVATIWFRSAASNRIVRTVRSASTGRFSAALVPGQYVVEPRPGQGIARPVRPRRTVRVYPHRFTAIRIDYDSGIR